MTGQLSVAEVSENVVEKDLLKGGVLGMTIHKKSIAKALKSTGSVLGVDEIDSECRTQDEDHHADSLL